MLLLILLLILIFAAIPAWPYSRGWGYYPSGGLGTVLAILIVLMLLGYVHVYYFAHRLSTSVPRTFGVYPHLQIAKPGLR